MKLKNLFSICMLTQLFFGCGNSEPSVSDADMSKIVLESPEYVRTEPGQTVEFKLNTSGIPGLKYTWKCEGEQFSSEKNPTFEVEKHGLFNIEVVVEDAAGKTKKLESQIFAAKKHDYKTVMYFPSWKDYTGDDWDKITHICLCFGEVKSDGVINVDDVKANLSKTITKAHENGVCVLLSLGGGSETNGFTEALLNEGARKKISQSAVKIIKDLKLDGIDVDYERWDYNGSEDDLKKSTELEKLYKELSEALTPEDCLLSAAISASYISFGAIKEPMIQYLDFVNFMIYDKTGPWSGSNVGPHSDWDFFISTMDIAKSINIPDSKIITGVPFYGYKFKSPTDAEGAEAIAYSDIVSTYPGAEDKNEISEDLIYYDGKPAVREKALYVKDNKLGGIMAWEITQDSGDKSKSLLVVIDEILETSR